MTTDIAPSSASLLAVAFAVTSRRPTMRNIRVGDRALKPVPVQVVGLRQHGARGQMGIYRR
jgi:hypothetical protein